MYTIIQIILYDDQINDKGEINMAQHNYSKIIFYTLYVEGLKGYFL